MEKKCHLERKESKGREKGGSTEMSENDLFHEPDSGYPGSSETVKFRKVIETESHFASSLRLILSSTLLT